MIQPVQLILAQTNGTKRNIIIEPILKSEEDKSLQDIGTYKIFKDAFGEESALFTEPLEINEESGDLNDNLNPDYLGKIKAGADLKWVYEGDLLSEDEQKQLGEFIVNFKE